jgi:ABC transporter DrrB family efflux protein
MLLLLAVLDALLGTALGLLVSAFARTEFEAVQFLPAILVPQFLLCGILVPRDRMLGILDAASRALPMTYVVDAMSRVRAATRFDAGLGRDIAVIAASVVLALALAAVTLRRRSN